MPASQLQRVADIYVNFITEHAVPKAMTLTELQGATTSDATLQYLIHVLMTNKWNSISSAKIDVGYITVSQSEVQLFAKVKDETLTTDPTFILRGPRIVLPNSPSRKATEIAQKGHQRLVHTKTFVRQKV